MDKLAANNFASPVIALPVRRAFSLVRFKRDFFAWDSLAFATVCLLDMISTLIWVHQGIATESNPMLAWCLAHGDAWFVVAKLASFVPALAIAARYRPTYPQFVPLVLRSALAGYVAIYVASVASQFLSSRLF